MNAMEQATTMAEDVYAAFLRDVLKQHVLNDRLRPSGKEQAKKIAKGSHINGIPLRLMTLSGKGGWHPDPQRRASYAANSNVTLLDHLLSVTRGALVLAALDWLSRNPAMSEAELEKTRQKLVLIAALGFLHDADKDLFSRDQAETGKTSREVELTPQHIEQLAVRYGIRDFLQQADISLDGAQLLYLLEKAEGTQAHRHPPAALPPREFERPALYVRLADKLDGIWLSADKTDKNGKLHRGGLAGVLERLASDEVLAEGCWLREGWRAVDIFDPHHPFLLDELQRWLTDGSYKLTGILPLLETHQDGRLFMLLPKAQFEAIVERGLKSFCKNLPFNQLRLEINVRGALTLYDATPSHEDLQAFVEHELSAKQISDILRTKAALHNDAEFLRRLDEMLGPCNLAPSLPAKAKDSGLASLYLKHDSVDTAWLQRAAHAMLLLNLSLDAKPKDPVPNYDAREQKFLEVVGEPRPDWIAGIDDGYSRRVVTVLWAVSLAVDDDVLTQNIWGDEGLLKTWLEGDEEHPGFNQFISGRGAQVSAAVRRHFEQLLRGGRVFPANEDEQGRCIFTDEPVPFGETIDSNTGLYGLKVSAFSGRDGRPELLTSDKAHTNVALVAQAEHRLRADAHQEQGGKEGGVPALISSPITVGLFGGLGLHTDSKGMRGMSLFDLSRLEIKKGKVYEGLEMYRERYRMARLESIPAKTADQANQLRMMLQACLRLGRPLHVFRGLPTLQRAFFYYDAMPRLLAELLLDLSDADGRSLRLEQIEPAIERLHLAQDLLDTSGLGYEVLRLYADKHTRLGAVCLAWCHLQDKELAPDTTRRLLNEYSDYRKGIKPMNENDGALIELGHLAAGIQKYVRVSGSTSKQMLVFNICLDTVNSVRGLGQGDEASLIAAITGELETELTRKGDAAANTNRGGKSLLEGCKDTAEWFVRWVWLGVLKGHAPSQRQRRILGSIYRVAFLQAHGEIAETKKEKAV